MVLLFSQSASEHMRQYGRELYAILQPHARCTGVGGRGRKRGQADRKFKGYFTTAPPGVHPPEQSGVHGTTRAGVGERGVLPTIRQVRVRQVA